MTAASGTSDDTLARAIGGARLAGSLMILIFSAAVLWASATVTIPNAVIVSGIVRAGAPAVKLRHPMPAYLAGTSVSLGVKVRRGDVIVELNRTSTSGTAEAIRMTSPVEGTVTALHYMAAGTLIPAFDTIATIAPADLAPLIELEAGTVHADHFEPGAVVPMTAGDRPAAHEFSAKVLNFGFPANGQTRPGALRIVLEPVAADPGSRDSLRPGMAVRTRILLAERSLLASLLDPASRILDEAFNHP